MGTGSYSTTNSVIREASYSTMDREEIFEKKSIQNEMNPANTMRGCCDSEEHPLTVPIIIALDVTGSMGSVPETFIKKAMTKMMASLYDADLKDAQVLFIGIGDHEYDQAPLQVGQFEADDELLDKWLKEIYLESGGGGNDGESYMLAWYYAARHTSIDSFTKRNTKGFLFTIGDEPTLKVLPADAQSQIFGGNGAYENVTAEKLLDEASEKYNVFHFHITDTYQGSLKSNQDGWKQKLGPNCIIGSQENIAAKIADIVKGVSQSMAQDNPDVISNKEEMML